MNIIDAIVILLIAGCAALGFKRGFTKELVCFLGFFVVILLAFFLKNPISVILYENLPFFSFGGFLKGVTALNILLYEVFAFLIVAIVLTIVLRILMVITSLFEKLLKMTIILGIPSKIMGAIVGLVDGFVWAFLFLYIVSLPFINFKEVNNSKFKDPILTKTPILSSFTKNITNSLNDFKELKEEYQIKENTKQLNYDTLELFLKYNIITTDSVQKLQEKGKLKIDNVDKLINQYKKEETNGTNNK